MQASGARQAKLMQLLQKAEALGKPVSHPYTAIKLEPDSHHSQMDFESLPRKSWYTIRLYRYIYIYVHQNSNIPFLLKLLSKHPPGPRRLAPHALSPDWQAF